MYTIKIENIEKNNGNPYASVSFTRDTGEIEVYRELKLVTPEVAEVRDPETDEVITPYAEAVYDYEEKTRPKLEVVHENIGFTTEEELNAAIVKKRDELIAKQNAASAIPVGEYTPTEVVEEPEVEPQQTPEEVARDAWLEQWRLYCQAKKGMDALQEAGIDPTEEETTRFNALKQWVADNRKPEYSMYL